MKKICALLLCAAMAFSLAACRQNNPTGLESTSPVWSNTESASSVTQIDFETAQLLISQLTSSLKMQAQGVDGAQVEATANLIVTIRKYRGSSSDEGKYLEAICKAYECTYGFYLKNSTDGMLESALKNMDTTYSGMSKLIKTSFKPIDHKLFQQAAKNFSNYGDTIIERHADDL